MNDFLDYVFVVVFVIGLLCGWMIADAGLDTKCQNRYESIKESCFKECGVVHHSSGIHFIKCTNEC